MPPPDAKAINALGRRLGRHDPPLADDVVLLGEVEARYVPALEAVSAVVRNLLGDPPSFEGVQLTVASRPLKTVDTIIEKLRRERTRLSTMRDIAGIRIVGENGLTRSQQDRLANRIAAQFPSSATTVDRRATPTHGYKALHLVVEVEGYPVEIQVRTDLQHAWLTVWSDSVISGVVRSDMASRPTRRPQASWLDGRRSLRTGRRGRVRLKLSRSRGGSLKPRPRNATCSTPQRVEVRKFHGRNSMLAKSVCEALMPRPASFSMP